MPTRRQPDPRFADDGSIGAAARRDAALFKLNPNGSPLDRKLLPEFLNSMAIVTLAGKWHLGLRKKAHLPNARGFDSFYGHVTGGVGYWDHARWSL